MNASSKLGLSRHPFKLAVAIAAICTAGVSFAQDGGRQIGGCPCSNPVNINVDKNSGPTNGHKPDFPAAVRMNQMTYNDQGINKHFTDTISWKLPTDSCEVTAVATWTVRNNRANGLQANDTTGIWLNGAPLVSHPIGSLPSMGTKTFSYTFTGQQAKIGRASVVAQDDSAVIDFKVRVIGCCIKPN